MLPSEYVDRNCFIGASNTKRRELGMRYEIGVDNILWGNDFPHPEGTWPNTREWLKKTFHDIPIDETRRMVGPRRGRGLRLRRRRACSRTPIASARRRPSSVRSPPTTRPAHASSRSGRATKAVGRHWLTGHDFALLDL